MPADIKAIVFKTTQLKATKDFFENILKLQIKESSARHFVLYSKSIRMVFVETPNDFEVEMYINDKSIQNAKEMPPGIAIADFKSYKDPNGMRIIIADKNLMIKK
jgi:catechol-2,3-dioxygenase